MISALTQLIYVLYLILSSDDGSLFFVIYSVPPRINGSRATDEQSVVVGGSLTLHCPATGLPQPDIQWSRQRQSLSFTIEPHLHVVDGGRQLQLYSAHLSDAGSYTCNATNLAGNATKQFTINVIGQFTFYPNYFFCARKNRYQP